MSDQSSSDNYSVDMELMMAEESVLNSKCSWGITKYFMIYDTAQTRFSVTTYFHDDIEISSTDDDSIIASLGDDFTEVPMDIASSPIKVTAVTESKYSKDDKIGDRNEVSTDMILSPVESKRRHMVLCPVCYEIAILSKDCTLYDNIMIACMEEYNSRNH